MSLISTVAADVLARPRPVLFLDTCEYLGILESVTPEVQPEHAEAAFKLLGAILARGSPTIVATYLTRLEWAQRLKDVREKVERELTRIDDRLDQILLVARHLQVTIPQQPRGVPQQQVIPVLVTLAQDLLNGAIELDRDEDCVRRAVARVETKRRPSHEGHIKDSIHLEHFFRLAELLAQSNFTEECFFVSSNKADFWEAKNQPRLHNQLIHDFARGNVRFFPTLTAVVGHLRL